MKIIYLDLSNIQNKEYGFRKKITGQINALRKLGHNVILLDSSQFHNDTGNIKSNNKSLYNVFRIRKKLIDKCSMLIEAKDYDLIYVRYPSGDPIFAKFAKKYGSIMITEHQTMELKEQKVLGKRLKYIMEKFYGKRIRRKVAAIVSVTSEVGNYQHKYYKMKNKNSFILGNGIDVSAVPVRNMPVFDGSSLSLLSVAHVAHWHGLDRIIKGLANYNGEMKINFDVVGDGLELNELKKLVKQLNLEETVLFHGFIPHSKLDLFFDCCHIAVGSLGIHRKGAKETAELKAREYCARGIPFICSAEDNDFRSKFPYRLKVPANEKAINLEALITFCKSVFNGRNHALEMREYAKRYLDWSVKMKKLLVFLDEIY